VPASRRTTAASSPDCTASKRSIRKLLATGKKDEATQALRGLASAFDKAAKSGVVHRATANRKKSRLALQFARKK